MSNFSLFTIQAIPGILILKSSVQGVFIANPLICLRIGDGEKWGINISYILQEEPLGLAHAVKIARDFLQDEPFLMYLGDNLLKNEINQYRKKFEEGKRQAFVLLTHVENPQAFGIVELEDKKILAVLKNADIIIFTIGGNDLMKVVKRDLFELKKSHFKRELKGYEKRLDELFGMIREVNSDAVIIAAGLYNPFTVLTDEAIEFEDIITNWNEVIEAHVVEDGKSCFVPVKDLFNSNDNMVYHTDFFHPNAKGYEEMTARILEEIERCSLSELSDGEWDTQGVD